MASPKGGVYSSPPGGGVVYEYTNDTATSYQPEYVEFTAPRVCLLEAEIDGTLVAKAWAGAGGAHSWWTAAGGRFLRYPLQPKQTLKITLHDEGAIRIDWYE